MLAQTGFRYSDDKRDLTISAQNGGGKPIPQGWKLDLLRNVSIASQLQKFTLKADKVTVDIASTKGSTSANEVKTATASGKVKIVQRADLRSSNIQSNQATYRSLGKTAQVDLRGSVYIESIDEKKNQTLVATGSSGTATLDKEAKNTSGLRQAILNGPVQIEVDQAGSEGSTMLFKGNKLTLSPGKAVLSGNVSADGRGKNKIGSFTNMDTLTVILNERNEMKSFAFSSGKVK
ncbi:MAG: hypothetical protein H7Y17_17110 [Chlorobia bacterium]|nr:hypothetical protein [Fimbriimonadaceae bacterium]